MSSPKRPLSSFMIFLKENREQIKKDNPDVKKATEIARIARQRWRALEDKSVSDHWSNTKYLIMF